jgi:hypothetical protein
MGLLDEAIREHLELKRRRGGDPGAIAREEREALAPGLPDEPSDDAAYAADEQLREVEASSPDADASMSAAAFDRGTQDDQLADLPAGGQETAELDMQAVMEDDPDAADPGAPERPLVDEVAFAGRGDEAPADDSLEWDASNERDREPPPEHIPGQERLSFE